MNMRRRLGIFVIVFILVLVLQPVVASPTGSGDGSVTVQNESDVSIDSELHGADGEVQLLVDFGDTPEGGTVEALQEHANRSQADFLRYAGKTPAITVENRFWLTNRVLVTVDTASVPLDSLTHVEGIERLEANVAVTATDGLAESPSVQDHTDSSATPADVTKSLELINASTVWERYGARGETVRVAVLDTGVDADHPDIDLYTTDDGDPTFPGGWAAFDESGTRIEDSEPYDTGNHGTHVTGTVAGGDTSGEYIGVAPDAEVMHGLVIPNDDGTTSQVIGGMEWAVANDADVIVMSLGSETYNGAFIDAVENARTNGVSVVAAIGNNGAGSSTSPGNVYGILSVGAVDESSDVPSFSGGERIDVKEVWHPLFESQTDDWPEEYVTPTVTAPGVSISSAAPGGGYRTASGTSMATPHVGGAVALIQSATDERISNVAIAHTLEETARKPASWSQPDDERDSRYGAGIIDVGEAVDAIESDELRSEFEIIHSFVNASTVQVGEPVQASIVVENTGNLDDVYPAKFRIDGTAVATERVVVRAGEIEQVSLTMPFGETGEYNLSVAGTALGTVTVKPPASYEVSNATLENETVEVGEPVIVTANVTNVVDTTTTAVPTLFIDDERAAERELSLNASESVQVMFEPTFETVGEYTLSIGDEGAGTVVVDREAGSEEWYRDYTTDDGRVEAGGLNAATQDYLLGDLDPNRLNLVIESYLRGDPITDS
jgi:subtilisin family serine protease